MLRALVPAELNSLGDDEVDVVMSTSQIARDGHILEPSGAELGNYRKNPIVLWQHDPEHPVARASNIAVDSDRIRSRIKFAPKGASKKADEIRDLVKSGIVTGLSVGFQPIDGAPIDPRNPRRGERFTKWELLEVSFCSVPV